MARRVATDKGYRQVLSQKILANTAKLFDDAAPIQALGSILQTLGREVIEGLPSGSTLPDR
jgi:hypothetical protein